MKINLILIFFALAKCEINAQIPCEEKLKNAKNSVVAIINSGGSSNKINQTATDVMTNMALNCPEMVKEFNKFIQNLDTKGLDGNVQDNYQTNQQRQKNEDELKKENNRVFDSNGTTVSEQKENPLGQKTYGIGNMKGDGYAELPFDDWDDEEGRNNPNRNVVNTNKPLVMNGTQRKDNVQNEYKIGNNSDIVKKMETLANTLETLEANGNEKYTIVDNFNALQRKLNANQISLAQAAIEFNAIKQRVDDIKAGKNQGYRPDTYINNSPVNLDIEIKNFENKLASVPENLKPDLLVKANLILKTETNKQEVALKLNNLMKEFEKKNGNIPLTNTKNYDCISRNSEKLSPYFEILLKNIGSYHKGTSADCWYFITVGQEDIGSVRKILTNDPNVTNLKYEPDGNFSWRKK